jgi:hypothetical protein
MEGVRHRLVRSEGMKDPPGQGSLSKAVSRLGGSCHAPRTRSEPSAEPPQLSLAPKLDRAEGSGSDAVAIPLASGFASAPATLIDGNQMPIVELREGDPEHVALVCARPAGDSELDGGLVAVQYGIIDTVIANRSGSQ